MRNILTRQYKVLSDHMDIYQFMIDIYEKDWRNGVPAPFLEYALSSCWMDKSYTHRYRIWTDEGTIVAFCFTENPVTDIYFSLRPGYEDLAHVMIKYAIEHMPNKDNMQRLVLFESQKALIDEVKRMRYKQTECQMDMIYDFKQEMSYELPQGFKFVDPSKINTEEVSECCWKGFDHEVNDGPWDGDAEHSYHLLQAPHATPQYTVVIENDSGEYVCFAGMWWTPENNLAYMEPLCTIPEYRHKGLSAAALTEMYRRLKPLGATHMTGGSNKFYEKIGYIPMTKWTYWKKE